VSLNGIAFVSATTGIAVARQASCCVQSMADEPGRPAKLPSNEDLFDVAFADNSIGWITGQGVSFTTTVERRMAMGPSIRGHDHESE